MTVTVLYVIGNLDIGGTERHLLHVLPPLSLKGVRPSVYTVSHKGALAPKLTASGIEVIAPPFAEICRRLSPVVRKPMLLLLSAVRLWLLMLRRRPAVTHFFLPEAYLLGGILSLLVPAPARVMSRRSLNEYQKKHPLLSRIERRLHSRMDAVIANSREVASQLVQEGVPEERLGLIYNGIDHSMYDRVDRDRREHVRAEFGVGKDALVMVLVANLIPYKGHADLLRALALAARDLPADWTLLCVGRDVGTGEALRGLAENQGIGGHILWLGEREDVPELLAASDIGLLCSHEEGFSNAILECMAAGLPMIVTDVGGNAEAVIDGESGYVVPARCPRALSKAIQRLAVDRTLRTSMGRNGQARVRTHFSANLCISNYVRLYEGLAGPSRCLRRELRSAEQQRSSVTS